MKKFILCLAILFSLISNTTKAQIVNCNGNFTTTYLSPTNVQFNPSVAVGNPYAYHTWLFGDGSSSNVVSPSHNYINVGTYTVKHIISVAGTNGTNIVCADSVIQTIQIQYPTNCAITASFVSTGAASSSLVRAFTNTTIGAISSDSIRWTFGDGTSASTYNATHTYANYGIYNVCLRIIKRSPNGVLMPTCVSEYCKSDTIVAPANPCATWNAQPYFTYSGDTTSIPSGIQFVNQSSGLAATDSIKWIFGDGSSSTLQNPAHTYSAPGAYNVCLVIYRPSTIAGTSGCTREYCKTITITQAPPVCNLVANFTIAPNTSSPTTHNYVNTSIAAAPTDSIRWTFGDGTSANTYNATHTYANAGVYTVCLRIIKRNAAGVLIPSCVKEFCRVDSVVIPCNLQAYFYSVNDTIGAPVAIQFINASQGSPAPISFIWNFGDGSNSTIANPIHTFAAAGIYTVCLAVTNQNGCTSQFCKQIAIVNPPPPCQVQAAFNQVATPSTSNPLSQYFANTSVNIVATDSIRWTFGDGTSANTFNANHVYANYGIYNVCLRVIKKINGVLQPNCVSEFCRLDTITAPVCNVQANFNIGNTTVNSLSQVFTNTSLNTSPTDSIRWTFGDGTTSSVYSPTHTYANYGVYNVCLRIIKRINGALQPNCISEFCRIDSIIAPANPCASLQPYFVRIGDTTVIPSVIQFANQTVGLAATDSIKWTFGDGSISYASNPLHTYSAPGTYNVCLIIYRPSFAAGSTPCIREYCKTITILQAPPVCNITAGFNILPVAASPLTKAYQNTSVGVSTTDSIRWTFGDGTSSSAYSPTHTYANSGVYQVCLRIIKRNPNGVLQTNCVREICKWDSIFVTNPCNVQAYFTTTFSSGTAPSVVVFTNQSTGILPTDSVRWTFGDGTFGTGATATHTYNAGTYTACVRIVRQVLNSTTPCVREYCKTFTITAPVAVCNILANFTWVRDTSVTIPNLFHFTNTTTGLSSTDSVRWTFGDGSSSTNINASHSYAQLGSYQVCLRVQKRNAAGVLIPTCVSTKCWTVVVAPITIINCNNITLSYTAAQDPLYVNRRHFTAISNAPMVGQTWTITKLPLTATSSTVTINQFNPTYAFLDSGSYRVCVKALYSNNCIKEYCNTLNIANPTPTTSVCNLQLYPNPASSVITGTVTLSQPLILYAFIYNSQNMLVAQKTQQGAVGINNVPVNIGNLPTGIYRYRLYYGFNACVSTFVKQ